MEDNIASAGWHSFRETGRFTYYGQQHFAATGDPAFSRVIFICAVFGGAALMAVLGIRGHERWRALVKVGFSVFVGVSILLCLFGHSWQVGFVTSKTAYSKNEHLNTTVGVYVGLNNVNITYAADRNITKPGGTRGSEHIFFNEQFHWKDRNSHIAESDFSSARARGAPFGLLTVADHLTADFGGWRWARQNRQAGYYTTMCLWTAFGIWILFNLTFTMQVSYAAAQMVLCGGLILLGLLLYSVLQPSNAMLVQLEDGKLTLMYGWSYWLTLASGVICCLVGIFVWLVDYFSPAKAGAFFDLAVQDEDYYYYDDQNDDSSTSPKTSKVSVVLNGGERSPKLNQYSRTSNDNRKIAFDTDTPELRQRSKLSNAYDNPVFTDDSGMLDVPKGDHGSKLYSSTSSFGSASTYSDTESALPSPALPEKESISSPTLFASNGNGTLPSNGTTLQVNSPASPLHVQVDMNALMRANESNGYVGGNNVTTVNITNTHM